MNDRLSGTLLLFHEASLNFPWGVGAGKGGGAGKYRLYFGDSAASCKD